MSDAHTTTVDRLRLFETTRRSDQMDRIDEAKKTDAAARGTLPAGTRVLDLVTGLEGVVIQSPAVTPTPSRLVAIRLDRGDAFVRRPDQLMPRPTPPSV